ncbi:site-specific DNA-methyltransferase [Chenggangzhangella methanolivorans]|uniref:Site-specific DNA-methyltransferase n=1 Tax=Chenggangzhangella methanolivorans TaxID=1437009 RepID=A0A9E6RB70_9HYPH|nr:site-specific DNA-methyltransferase [Chenggangzhangella methanolivorans]QZO01150.1 site-specific DNA-methyltransferase [Chenggangzhangella methanolivorans]
MGTNAGSAQLPFQGWRKFKEAFAPELIAMAVAEHPAKVHRIFDPFGGSGTTALAAQFLWLDASTIEINPYLADLIEAKLNAPEPVEIAGELARLLNTADRQRSDLAVFFQGAPKTLIEPGDKGRWILGREMAQEAASLLDALPVIIDDRMQRLFRVLLGAVIVDNSNAVISGKGRRYRKGCETRSGTAAQLRISFIEAVAKAAKDIAMYSGQRSSQYDLYRGDARELVKRIDGFDVAIYSPPYPNSFDYTDVYNRIMDARLFNKFRRNRALRSATLSSHVQLSRLYKPAPRGSSSLDLTLERLEKVAPTLWNKNIPAMIGSYFAEMIGIVSDIARNGSSSGRQWLIVGDSRYAGIDVPVGEILLELSRSVGLTKLRSDPFRSMRAAPQQGGRPELRETLIVLSN